MKITPEIKETRGDGTPYRVSRVIFEAVGVRDERLLASMADVLSRLDEVHITTNTVRLKGRPVNTPRVEDAEASLVRY